jgi:hypothetical protein
MFQVWVCHRGPRTGSIKKTDVKSFVDSHEKTYLENMGKPNMGLSNDGIPMRWQSIPELFDLIDLQKGKVMHLLLFLINCIYAT